jgi:hypothetical protein
MKTNIVGTPKGIGKEALHIADVSQRILSDYTDWLNEQDLTVNKTKTYGGFRKWFGLGWLNKKVSSEDLVKKFLSEYGG